MNKDKKKIGKSVIRLLLLVIISLFLGGSLYLWNAETLVGNAMPMPFGWGFSVVLSGSMEPTLHVNDMVVVSRQDSYAVGDIIVYQDGRSLVIHRVVSVSGDMLTTQGDANDIPDAPIPLSAVKGKAITQIPLLGSVLRFLKSPIGFGMMLVLAIVLFEVPYFRRRKKDADRRKALQQEIEALRETLPQEQDSSNE